MFCIEPTNYCIKNHSILNSAQYKYFLENINFPCCLYYVMIYSIKVENPNDDSEGLMPSQSTVYMNEVGSVNKDTTTYIYIYIRGLCFYSHYYTLYTASREWALYGAALFRKYLQVSLAAPGPTWIRRYSHATSNQPYIHQRSAVSEQKSN